MTLFVKLAGTAFLLTGTLLLAGCGGSSSTSMPDIQAPIGAEITDLSHTPTPILQNPVNPSSTALYSTTGRDKAASIADTLAIVYEVVENHGGDAFPNPPPNCQSLEAQYSSCSIVNLHIKDATGLLNDGNWKIYFHSIRRILRVDSEEFSVSRVNGDLNFLEPTDQFQGFSGGVKTIGLVTEFSHLIESDFMPRYWLVSNNGSVVTIINNTDEETDESQYAVAISGDNRRAFNGEPIPLATASSRFAKNDDVQTAAAALNSTSIQARIIPKPQSVTLAAGSLDISSGFSFASTDLTEAAQNALTARQTQFMSTAPGVSVSAVIDSSLTSNSYTMAVDASGIQLTGADQQALFYAAQSLLSLVQPGVGTIPYVVVNDAPRFTYRGMHIDVARNFHSVATMKRLIDQMAAYKLNKLHLHLSDDEGWRLQINSFPELTAVGATRRFQLDSAGNVTEGGGLMPQLGSGPFSVNQGTGFYTQQQFVELLRYAADRHIDVIPEFDMPAHARAAVVAMRARAVNLGDPNSLSIRLDDPDDTSRYLTVQHYNDGILNPCIPGTYTFIEKVIQDVQVMYSEAGVVLDSWHMGGDEAINVYKGGGFTGIDTSDWDYPWEQSPACAELITNSASVNSRDDLQLYFVREVAQRVADAGIETFYAYQDIYDSLSASELATQRAGVGYWEPVSSGNGYNNINGFSNRGFETIVAVPDFLYFDFPQEVDPEERGYYWATRFTDTRKVFSFAPENLPQNAETTVNREGASWTATGDTTNQGFTGMQGQLWSETVRTPEQFDFMVFPRLLALAERAWATGSWELPYQPGTTFSASTALVDKTALLNDYAQFSAALGNKELKKLDAAGVSYRIPVPGALAESGVLTMNSDLPGLPLEYSTDGVNYSTYTTGTSSANVQFVRARSSDGSRAGRADTLSD